MLNPISKAVAGMIQSKCFDDDAIVLVRTFKNIGEADLGPKAIWLDRKVDPVHLAFEEFPKGQGVMRGAHKIYTVSRYVEGFKEGYAIEVIPVWVRDEKATVELPPRLLHDML